jgi:hypothetical protein
MHIAFAGFAIITGPGLTIRLGRYEVFAHRPADGSAPRLDLWSAQGALYVRLGVYEVVANKLPPVTTERGAGASASA